MKRKNITRGVAAAMAAGMLVTVSGSNLMFEYAAMINKVLNVSSSKIINTGDGSDAETIYYASEFGTDYTNKQDALKVETAVAAENVLQAEEGNVLMKNDNDALPLQQGNRITLFGNGSTNSKVAESSIGSIPTRTFNYAMQQAFGEENVNLTLSENVYSKLGTTSAREVVEAPISDVTQYESSWANDYNDAAVVMITRVGAEANDTAMYAEDGTRFLALQKNEQDLMAYLKQQKDAGVFDKIIAVINSEQAMELDWLETYDVDACLLAGAPGAMGFEGTANILAGLTNPSGHTVDTYASNSLSAPANTYANDNTQMWGNVDEVNSTCTDTTNNGQEIDYYTIYAEGIYVGYKYYETRYEDTVLGAGNANSITGSSTGNEWNYTDEVCYTFGHGLSYTTFDQVLEGVTYNAETDTYDVTVNVTNTGDMAGRSVVQVYAQTPYGDYEKNNLVEKSAVQIVGFEKTETLEPGTSEKVVVSCDRYFLASYDAKGAQGYILSAGDYYLSVGDNAHDALNNILAAKGYTTADGMDYDGNAAKTYTWNQAELDTQTYRLSRYTDAEVTNQFDHADLNSYGVDFTYLSRSDWEGTFPEEAVIVNATAEMMKDLDTDWYETPEDAPAVSDFNQGVDSGMTFADMYNVAWEDTETWNKFLDQMTVEDMATLMKDANGSAGVDSINMPSQVRTDDNIQGGVITATGENALTWVSETMTARTWNKDRFSARGELVAIEGVFCGVSEFWYGGGNIHRTPFGGRNQQYFSEDGNFGYIVGAYEAQAMQNQGVAYCIKHFALNDQDSHRESLNTFANEQTVRENYLRVFEGAFCEGGALSVMTAFNKIGVTYTAANVNLLQNVLRGEWGFKGHVTTDGFTTASKFKNHYMEMVAAGVDYVCLDSGTVAGAVLEAIENGDGYMMECLRNATKRNVYVASRSVAMNGLSSDTVVVTVVPWWQTALLAATAVFAVGFVACTVVFTVDLLGEKKSGTRKENRT